MNAIDLLNVLWKIQRRECAVGDVFKTSCGITITVLEGLLSPIVIRLETIIDGQPVSQIWEYTGQPG